MRLEKVSTSQVTAYERCPRIWYNQTVLKRREPPGPAQLLGIQHDKDLEAYYDRKAEKPKLTPMLLAALEHLPPPAPDIATQVFFKIQTYTGGPLWIGYMDWLKAQAKPHPLIIDHKTTKDLKYAKAKHQIKSDLQLMSYVWAATSTGLVEGNEMDAGWLFVRSTPARDKRHPSLLVVSEAPISRAHACDVFVSKFETVKSMVGWAAEAPETAQALPPNPNACYDYNKACPHLAECGLVKSNNLWRTQVKQEETKTMGLFDQPTETKTEEKTNGTGIINTVVNLFGGGAGSAVTSPDAPADAHIPPFVVGDKVKWEAGQFGPAGAGAIIELQNKGTTAYVRVGSDKAVSIPCRALSIAPNMEVVPEVEKPKRGRPPKSPKLDLQGLYDAAVAAEKNPLPLPSPEQIAAAGVFVIDPAVTGAGPKGITTTGDVPTLESMSTRSTQATAAPAPRPIFDLGIGALPTKGYGTAVLIEDWARPALEATAAANNVPDYRLIDFGKGKGALAVQLLALIAKAPLPPLLVISDPHTALGEVANEILAPYARFIWRKLA